MKINICKILAKANDLKDEEFRVYFYILNSFNMNSNEYGEFKIKRKVLSTLTGKSERTISRLINKLEAKKLINVKRGTKQENVYKLNSTIIADTGDTNNEKELETPVTSIDDIRDRLKVTPVTLIGDTGDPHKRYIKRDYKDNKKDCMQLTDESIKWFNDILETSNKQSD